MLRHAVFAKIKHLPQEEKVAWSQQTTRKLRGDAGVFASPVLYPAVPPGMALIRTSCMATHTVTHLDQVLDVFGRVGRDMGLLG